MFSVSGISRKGEQNVYRPNPGCVLANDFSRISLAARTSQLLTLFRSFLPDLYSHFEDEEVAQGWATSWSKYLLAKELPIECTMRLWDTFFSTEEGLDFHPFVCLAILREIRESVEGSCFAINVTTLYPY